MDEIIKNEEPKKLPWDQMEGEPSKAYYYFGAYLSLGAGRTLARAAKALNLNPSTLSKLAKKWDWDNRAVANDKLYCELQDKSFLLEMEARKENFLKLRTDVSEHAYHALLDLSFFLRDFWSTFENPKVLDKLKFINQITRSIQKLYKLIDQPYDSFILDIKSRRDININNILSLDGNLAPIADEMLYANQNIKKENEEWRRPANKEHYETIPPFDQRKFEALLAQDTIEQDKEYNDNDPFK